MEKREGIFRGVDGSELFYQIAKPESTPKAVVICIHGLGDHSGGLQNLTEQLTANDCITYAYDLRGHGRSPGVRGFIRTWDEHRGDLHALRELVMTEVPHLPLYILSHSLGGVISLDYALHHGQGISGLMVIAPAISYELKLSEKWLVTLLGKLKPDFTIQKSGSVHSLTKDPDTQTRLLSDKLRHSTVTPGLGLGLLQTIPRIYSNAASLTMPLLLQYGLEDEITPPAKLRQFFDAIGSSDKQKYEYSSMRHRPFDDLEREQFFTDLIGWLDRQTAVR